jgi:hypothetical protein
MVRQAMSLEPASLILPVPTLRNVPGKLSPVPARVSVNELADKGQILGF